MTDNGGFQMQGDWVSGVIDELARCKRRGMTFEMAWAVSYRKHRPSRRDVQGVEAGDLFEMAKALEEESLPQFVKRAADDAWHGRRPELAHLTNLRLDGDLSPFAGRVDYQAAGAARNRVAA